MECTILGHISTVPCSKSCHLLFIIFWLITGCHILFHQLQSRRNHRLFGRHWSFILTCCSHDMDNVQGIPAILAPSLTTRPLHWPPPTSTSSIDNSGYLRRPPSSLALDNHHPVSTATMVCKWLYLYCNHFSSFIQYTFVNIYPHVCGRLCMNVVGVSNTVRWSRRRRLDHWRQWRYVTCQPSTASASSAADWRRHSGYLVSLLISEVPGDALWNCVTYKASEISYHTWLFLPLCIIVMVQSFNPVFWFPSFKTSSIAKSAFVCSLRETFNSLRKLLMASSSLSDFVLISNGSSSWGRLLTCRKAGSKFVRKVLVTPSPNRQGVL